MLKHFIKKYIETLGELTRRYNETNSEHARDKIEEYALVSNIIMGSDRYFYIEIPHPSNLINIFVKISNIIIKDNKEESDKEVTYIDERMLKSPAIALHQVRKEMSRMFEKAYETLMLALDAFIAKDDSKHGEVDSVNNELELTSKKVIEYLVEIANEKIVFEDECTVSAFHRTLDDILRVGEIGDNLCKCTRRAVREDLNISELAISQLINMKSKITDLYSNFFINAGITSFSYCSLNFSIISFLLS